MAKLSVRDLDVRGKRVFLRVDYNVPLEEKDGQMVITDSTRIVETLPTLKLLIEKGGKLVLTAHLGRPKGKREATMSLAPLAVKLSKLLGKPGKFVDNCIGEKVESAVAAMKDGDVTLLENVRYYNEEEANDTACAEKLAKVADVYVNDAFGAAHRAHASTEGVARVVAKRGGKCAAGLLMERELKFLGDELENRRVRSSSFSAARKFPTKSRSLTVCWKRPTRFSSAARWLTRSGSRKVTRPANRSSNPARLRLPNPRWPKPGRRT